MLGDFDKANQSKGTSDDFIELVPIPLLLKQPKNEKKKEKRKLMSYQEMIVLVTYMHKS